MQTPPREPFKAGCEREQSEGRPESKPHQMAMQVPHRLHPQVPAEKPVQGVAEVSGRGIPGSGWASRERDRGGSFDV